MKKYIYLILIIIAVIIAGFYLTNNGNTHYNLTSGNKEIKTYSANGISFNYTENWELINKTGKYVIVSLNDTKANKTDNKTDSKPSAVVEISKKASEGIPLEKFYDEVKIGASGVSGYRQLSEDKIVVDNKTAYEFTASGMDNGVEEQYKVVLFEKGGFIYMIACGTREPLYLTDKNSEFDVIINSFKVQ